MFCRTRLATVYVALAASAALPVSSHAQWMLPGNEPASPPPADTPEPQANPAPAAPARTAKPNTRNRSVKAVENPYPYYIEFRSRGAVSYGHTFVMFGKTDSLGNMLPGEVAGLHPAGGTAEYVAGHYLPVPAETGPSDGDLDERYITKRYRINLTPAQYEKVVGHIRYKQATSKVWHAVLNNCNGFAGEIANFMGLQAPSHMLMPPDYIERLRQMNKFVSNISLPDAPDAQAGSATVN